MALTRSRSEESRRISSLLIERRVSSAAMLLVLASALFLGLIGFAIHVLSVVAVIIVALGLGYVLANGRQDRVEFLQRRRRHANAAQELTPSFDQTTLVRTPPT